MRRVDMSLVSPEMIAQSNSQEPQSAFAASWSSDRPVMKTPVDKNIIVYFPKDWQERKHELLMHSIKKGESSVYTRCISGLSTGFDALGYTGECPACTAMDKVWKVYRAKLEIEAKRFGVDPENDTADILKGVKEKLRREMAITGAEKFMVFPVVIIPTDNDGNPILDGKSKPEANYVIWKTFRWEKKMMAEDCMEGVTDPSGHYFKWRFKYTSKDNKQPNARDAARELTCRRIMDSAALEILSQFTESAEAVVAPFTQAEAIEQIKCANFYYYEDGVAEVKNAMRSTEALLASLEMAKNGGGVETCVIGAQAPVGAIGTAGATNPADVIANLGKIGDAPTQMGVAPAQPVQNASGIPQVGKFGN